MFCLTFNIINILINLQKKKYSYCFKTDHGYFNQNIIL